MKLALTRPVIVIVISTSALFVSNYFFLTKPICKLRKIENEHVTFFNKVLRPRVRRHGQGDQIGRFFSSWAIFSLVSFFLITEEAQIVCGTSTVNVMQ
jgi:hypothetical protein